MYKKVLLPISGENNCQRGLKALPKAMRVCDGEIVLLHVTEPVAQIVGGDARAELQKQHEAEGQKTMAPVIEKLKNEGARFHTRVVAGTIAETIISTAHEEKADLIVMFTDGRDDIGDMLLGSMTERVLRNVEIDVLAVRR